MIVPVPRTEATRILVDVAAGRRPADLVIRNGRWVNVHSGEILPGTDLTIACGRFASCGLPADGRIGPETEVIDAAGRFLVPGLLDAHVHIESSMLTLTQYAAAVLPHGTTGVFLDPHEIANVLGLTGVELFLDEARELPLAAYVQIPSCVPAASALETGGASLSPADIDAALAWPGVIGLGEMMDFPGVAAGDPSVHAKLAAALRRHAVIGGHYASPDLGTPFHAYVAGGPADCHEGRTAQDLRARVRQGMAAMVRQGSAWRDLERQLPALLDAEAPVDPRHVLLCTDDRHAETLLREGHMDAVLRDAIAAGIDPITAIQMATLNTAEHFGLADEVGSIAPGRRADLLLVEDLNALHPQRVIAAGHVVAEGGALRMQLPSPTYPPEARSTVRLSGPLTPDALIPACPAEGPTAARVIGIRVHDVVTESLAIELKVQGGALQRPEDLAWLAVVERHHGTGRIGHGLARGFGLRTRCGLASTIAHDSHNLIVLGSCPDRMAEAANHVAAIGGGVALATEEGIVAALPLPIAGLMSDQPAATVAAAAAAIDAALADCGCTLEDALMTLSFLALPVIPALRLTDKGLVDVLAQRLVPLFLEPDNPRR
jgi:adenine deaminase